MISYLNYNEKSHALHFSKQTTVIQFFNVVDTYHKSEYYFNNFHLNDEPYNDFWLSQLGIEYGCIIIVEQKSDSKLLEQPELDVTNLVTSDTNSESNDFFGCESNYSLESEETKNTKKCFYDNNGIQISKRVQFV